MTPIRGDLSLYPKRMERVEVFLMKNDLNKVIDDLQSARIIQSVDIKGSREIVEESDLLEMKSKLQEIIEFLVPMENPVRSLRNLLKDPSKHYIVTEDDVRNLASLWLASVRADVDPLMRNVSILREDMEYIRDLIQRLTQISGLSIDLTTLSFLDIVRVKVGTTRRFGELLRMIEEVGGNLEGSLIDRKEGIHAVRIAYTRSLENKISDALRGRLFTEMTIDVEEIVAFLKRYNEDINILNLEISRLIPRLEKIEDHLKEILDRTLREGTEVAGSRLGPARAYLELVEIEIEKKRYSSGLFGTHYTNRISGWVERDRVPALRDILQTRCPEGYHIDHRPPTREEIDRGKVPTKLSNNWLGSMFESLTNTFAVPRYDEIDPSIWISIPFILFFGLMLGDAGYGLLIMIISGLVIIVGSRSGSLRTTAWMGFLMGLATTLSGIWMGAFFGDLIPRVILGEPGSSLYGPVILGVSMPYDTLKDPMLLFQISLYIGLAQLNLGILLFGIDRLVKKNVYGFIKGALSWVLIQIGAIVFVGAMLIGWWDLNPTLSTIGGITFGLGAFLLALESKGMVLFDIEGYLGDLISYTRILALGLSTFGLAMAFNIVGNMLIEIHLATIPLVIILLLLLHVFNLLLQTLGAAVHSLRLQFVEFFGRFYEGGGIPFEPFGMERIHTSKDHVGVNYER